MNFDSMDYFAVIAKERSFTKAAERLHITQQSLSAHIASLERELGCKLLVRSVPLQLTYAGEVFLRYASRFRQELTMMRQEFSDIAGSQSGRLRIGIAHTRGRSIMPKLIVDFQRRYPQLHIELAEATNERLTQMLLDHSIDLAIANFTEGIPGIELVDFYWEEIVLLASHQLLSQLYGEQADEIFRQASEGDLSVLRDCPFLLLGADDIGGRIALEVLHRADIQPDIKTASHNVETLLSLCTLGAGACFCPANLVRATLTDQQMGSLRVIPLGDDARYPIRFGYRKGPYQWSILSAFIESASESMAERAGQ